MMQIDDITAYVQEHFPGTIVKDSYGERAFFYNPGNLLPSGTYFLTIKEQDGPHDKASRLDREGVYRLNFGASKETFRDLFGVIPARPPKGEIIEGPYDFAALDTLMPHPVYGWSYWLCVLNPSRETFDKILPLIQAYYEQSKKRFEKRTKTKGPGS
jgi:hypothetical protein